MRHWWLIPVIAVALIMLARPLQAAWLKNLAVLKLQPAWSTQRTWILDPPCGTKREFSVINKYLESSIVIDPHNLSALTDLGRVLWLEGDCADATAQWEQASMNHDPAAIDELFRIGDYKTFSPDMRLMLADYAFSQAEVLAKDPKNEAASQWFNRAFELLPQHRTVYALIELQRENGGTFDASGMWQRMIDIYPDTDVEHWYAVAELYILNANWESAARSFTEGARLTSDSYDLWMRAGNAWEQVHNWEQAEASYEHANQVSPEYIDAYLGLGSVYRVQQKYQVAIYWYSKANELFPQDSLPYFRLGETYFLMEDYTQARRNLEAVLEIVPTDQTSMYMLAQTYYREGNPSLAESWLVNAINHEPNPQNLYPMWVQLGDWKLEWHNCSGALEAYTNASHAGEDEETIQQNLKKFAEVCSP